MELKKTNFKKMTITLPLKLLEEYKSFSKSNGFNMSRRIAILLRRDLKNKVTDLE